MFVTKGQYDMTHLYPVSDSDCFHVAASPPSEFSMHQAPPGPAHQERAYEFVGCPIKADSSDINPANMVQL